MSIILAKILERIQQLIEGMMYCMAVDDSFKDFMLIKPPGEISYFSFVYHALKKFLKNVLKFFLF